MEDKMNVQETKTLQRITHKGKEIFYADYSNIDMLALPEAIKENERWTRANADKFQDVLVLTNVTGTHIDMDGVKAFQSASKTMAPLVKGSAVVGITGIRRILTEAVNRFSSVETKIFNDEAEAKDWLVGL